MSRRRLYGPQFLRVFPDVYVPAGGRLDLAMRSRAAYCYVADRGGVLAGFSAAQLLGAGCALRRVPAEVLVPRDVRRRPDLLVRRGIAAENDVCEVAGCRVTIPLRTAWDLARRLSLVEAVVAVDALARCGRFDPAALLGYRAGGRPAGRSGYGGTGRAGAEASTNRAGARGCRRLERVVALSDPRAESVMESQLRLHLVLAGLPAPAVQYQVVDPYGFVIARLDLAYPDAKLAIEYDGGHHFTDDRSRRDRRRDLELAALGWHTMRFTRDDVDGDPAQTPVRVAAMLAARLPASTSTAMPV